MEINLFEEYEDIDLIYLLNIIFGDYKCVKRCEYLCYLNKRNIEIYKNNYKLNNESKKEDIFIIKQNYENGEYMKILFNAGLENKEIKCISVDICYIKKRYDLKLFNFNFNVYNSYIYGSYKIISTNYFYNFKLGNVFSILYYIKENKNKQKITLKDIVFLKC